MLKLLLRATKPIDLVNERIGQAVRWLVLIAVLIATGNALVRYGLNVSSNAWLEAQWYLFSAVFLLCSGYTLQRNEHVRIDVFASQLSHRTQAWIDVFGGVVFLLPMSIMIMVLSWPIFTYSFRIQEISTDAGGLIRWPVKLLMPVGFLLLTLQGVAEIIKRIAFLAGVGPDPIFHGSPAELELIDELKAKEGQP